MSASISSYSKTELPEVLSSLKTYKKMLKEMGSRASKYFFTDMTKSYRVEYDPTMESSLVESYVLAAFAKYFDLSLTLSDIRLDPNASLVSGVRVFA